MWQDDTLLVIGWGTSVKIASVRANQSNGTNGTHRNVSKSSMNQPIFLEKKMERMNLAAPFHHAREMREDLKYA